jgi:hypothetical protein
MEAKNFPINKTNQSKTKNENENEIILVTKFEKSHIHKQIHVSSKST